jgi:alkylation response protein AidB-like acyl-CoA dehydrogenase
VEEAAPEPALARDPARSRLQGIQIMMNSPTAQPIPGESFEDGLGPPVPGRDSVLAERARAAAWSVLPRYPHQSPLDRETLLELFGALNPLGYLGSTIGGELGGAGLSLSRFASILDGTAGAAPFLSNHSVQRYLASAGTEDARTQWLPGLLDGSMIAAVAVTEAHGGTNIKDLQTRISAVEGGLTLSGSKAWVTHAMTADIAVVLASDSEGRFRRIIVDLAAPGVQRLPLKNHGLKHLSFGTLSFDRTPVQSWQILNDEGISGAKEGFATARALVAVQAVSIGFQALKESTLHLQSRTARSARVTDLDFTMHRIGDLAAQLYAARLMAYHAVLAIEDRHPSAAALASGAKAHATSIAVRVCTELVSICAGFGLDSSAPISARRDDVEMLATADGTSVVNTMLWGSHIKKLILGLG